MSAQIRSRWFILLVTLLGSSALGGCGTSDAVDATTSSPSIVTEAPPTPSAAGRDGGTITLSDDGCIWEGNPGSMSEGRLTVAVRNTTDDFGLFIVHQLRAGRTFDEGRAAIATIQEALKTGAEWPEEISDPITEATAGPGLDGYITKAMRAGTFGVVCSANTSPTGDILTVFLVGPLEVTLP